MSDNFNINTSQEQSQIAGGIDPNTGLGIGNTLYSSLLNQRSQEEAVNAAQMRNQQMKEAMKLGVNTNLTGLVSREAAREAVKSSAQRQELLTPPLEARIDAWANALPEYVSQVQVDAQISKYQPKQKVTHAGQASEFSVEQDIPLPLDDKGNPVSASSLGLVEDKVHQGMAKVPSDGMYQVLYDNDGNMVKFIPGGKVPVDPSVKENQQQSRQDQKYLIDFGNKISGDVTLRNAQAANRIMLNAIGRAKALGNQILTQPDGADVRQQMEEVMSVLRVLTGGAGAAMTEGEINQMMPQTLRGTLMNKLEYLAGKPKGAYQQAFTKRFLTTLDREQTTITDQMNEAVSRSIGTYYDVLHRNPESAKNILARHKLYSVDFNDDPNLKNGTTPEDQAAAEKLYKEQTKEEPYQPGFLDKVITAVTPGPSAGSVASENTLQPTQDPKAALRAKLGI